MAQSQNTNTIKIKSALPNKGQIKVEVIDENNNYLTASGVIDRKK